MPILKLDCQTDGNPAQVSAVAVNAKDLEKMKHESARMRRVYRAGWLAFRALFRVYLRWKVYSPHNVPLRGPVILASNHASFFDAYSHFFG